MVSNKYLFISIFILFSSFFIIFYISNQLKTEWFSFKNLHQLLLNLNNKDICFKNVKNKKTLITNLNFNFENNKNNLLRINNNWINISIFKNNLFDLENFKIKNNLIKIDKKNWKIYLLKSTWIKNIYSYYGVIDLSENKKFKNKKTNKIIIKILIENKFSNLKIKHTLSYPNNNYNKEIFYYFYMNYSILIFNSILFILFYNKVKNNLRNGKFYSNLFIIFFSSYFIVECFFNFNLSLIFRSYFYHILIISILYFLIYCFMILKLLNFFTEYLIYDLRHKGLSLIEIKRKLFLHYLKNYFIYVLLIYFGILFYGTKIYFIIYFSLFFIQNIVLWNLNKIYIPDQKILFFIYLTKSFNLIYININSNNIFYKNNDINLFFICIIFLIFQYIILSLQLLIRGNFIKGFINNKNGVGKYFVSKKILKNNELKAECSICLFNLEEDNCDCESEFMQYDFINKIKIMKKKFIFKTNCNHYFHLTCMLTHLTYKNICPNCREEINDIEI